MLSCGPRHDFAYRGGIVMRRRTDLTGAGSIAAATTISAPGLAQASRELKMVTDWPAGFAGLQSSAVRLAETIGIASAGRIRIEVFSAGTLVRPFETFDAVGVGVADMFHSAATYFGNK